MVDALARRQTSLLQRLAAVERGVQLVSRFDAINERLSSLEERGQAQAPNAGSQQQQQQPPSTSARAAPPPPPQGHDKPAYMYDGPPPSVTPGASATQQRLERELIDKGFSHFRFARVAGDYYENPLEYRMQCVGAASIDHLCKSIIMENTKAHASVDGWTNPCNSKYYTVLVQYTARLNPEKIKSLIHGLNNGKIGKQWFNMRLCKPEVNDELTGYPHNAVSPIGMAEPDVPMIMSHKIAELLPEFFWLGGGEVDLKLGLPTGEFLRAYNPLVADITF